MISSFSYLMSQLQEQQEGDSWAPRGRLPSRYLSGHSAPGQALSHPWLHMPLPASLDR